LRIYFTDERREKMKRLLSLLIMALFLVWISFGSALALMWTPSPGGPDAPEVSIVGDSIIMGIHNDTEDDYQAESLHGASALLPVGPGHWVTFKYKMATWDSYNTTPGFQPNGEPTVGLGWWDSFSVSTSGSEYWHLTLTDHLDSGNPLDSRLANSRKNILEYFLLTYLGRLNYI
jgi:hypothetical protein